MATFDQVPDGDELPISATLFVTYRRCPQQALARFRGIYPPPTRASFKGALAHRLIARHLVEGPIDADDIEMACREETGAHLNQQLTAIGVHTMSGFRAIVAEVSDLYARFAALPMEPVREAEMTFDVEVGHGVSLRGRIDAVFEDPDGTRIVDWKTGPHLGEAVDAQLAFYALAWQRLRGQPPTRTDAISVATGERRVEEPNAETLSRTESEIVQMIHHLRHAITTGGELSRTAGPHCRWCPILDDCDEGAAAVELLT